MDVSVSTSNYRISHLLIIYTCGSSLALLDYFTPHSRIIYKQRSTACPTVYVMFNPQILCRTTLCKGDSLLTGGIHPSCLEISFRRPAIILSITEKEERLFFFHLTAATGLFCRGGKIESRLLKFCQSHAIPPSGMAKCDSAKFKQSAITFCLLIKVVRPRQ